MKNKTAFSVKALMAMSSIMAFAVITPAQASDGQITFIGKVSSSTCKLSVNGGGAINTVNLLTVSNKVLNVSGETAGDKSFYIAATECAGATKMTTFFEFGKNVDAANNYTLKSTGSAANVNIQLVDENGTALKVGQKVADVKEYVTDASGAVNMTYAARYYATGAATAGDVKTDVTYSVEYL